MLEVTFSHILYMTKRLFKHTATVYLNANTKLFKKTANISINSSFPLYFILN